MEGWKAAALENKRLWAENGNILNWWPFQKQVNMNHLQLLRTLNCSLMVMKISIVCSHYYTPIRKHGTLVDNNRKHWASYQMQLFQLLYNSNNFRICVRLNAITALVRKQIPNLHLDQKTVCVCVCQCACPFVNANLSVFQQCLNSPHSKFWA